MKLLIVGAGAMGRWVADTLSAEVAFADTDSEAAEAAAAAHDARAVSTDTDERFDAVCLAVPISAVESAIAAHAPNADRAVFDVTGVMAGPLSALREHAADCERASYHPLFAPENAPGNVAAVVDEGGPTLDAVDEAFAAAGNDVFETTAGEHDGAMKTVQSGAHAAVLAYALAAEDVREEFATPVSAALDDVVDTVTGGTPRVYAEIQETFDGATGVAEAAARIADAEGEAFEKLYREAGRHETADPEELGRNAGDGDDSADDGGENR
ncbi:prephenate dehydrogenase/arogenate dehydrogenase family protein [Haloprofundus halophilus]|uniref:prephenate dehydrogenase/arogenate dehydrogenase family protein n=1 Tax=Haloprofundus halophilus TaxID=2283527 RepID=UPI000E447B33|nr:prephenate dehydrogenase/arogenate dehydrogenase family protein [Haloprofundus halophilus]